MPLITEPYNAQQPRWPRSGRHVLARYAKEWLLGVEDISDFVAEQRENAKAPYERLVTPREEVYSAADPEVASRLGLSET